MCVPSPPLPVATPASSSTPTTDNSDSVYAVVSPLRDRTYDVLKASGITIRKNVD